MVTMLALLIPALPGDLRLALVIVQHMPAGFTAALAERLDAASKVSVREAQVGDRPLAGGALIAPGDRHLEFDDRGMVILTDEYIERDKVDPVIVRKELAEVQDAIAKLAAETTLDEAARAKAKALIERENWLAAQLELYGDPPPATMRPLEEWGPPDPTHDEDVPPPESAAETRAH
jgi:hypothetical protein